MTPETIKRNHEQLPTKEPWEMGLREFIRWYRKIMKSVKEKEKGPMQPLTESEKLLINKDWKAFSKKRGYTKQEIDEYEQWLKLSGQRDGLNGAINDPWRRPSMQYWEYELFVKHIENAQQRGINIPSAVLQDCKKVKQVLEKCKRPKKTAGNHQSIPTPNDHAAGDVW